MILDKKSVNILKALKQNDDILNLDQLSVLTKLDPSDILDHLVFLQRNHLIRVVDYEQPKFLPEDGQFQITIDGKIFLQERIKTAVLTWSPMILSAIAIIISVIALFC